MRAYDGIVVAGGRARRLGGLVKPALEVGGRRLIDTAIAAVEDAAATIVVGEPMDTALPVTWTREDPVGGGPAAAVAAALAHVEEPVVVVLAADLPFVTAEAVTELVSAMQRNVAAVGVDGDGYDQTLLACYDAVELAAAIPASGDGVSMRSVLRRLGARGGVARVALGGDPPPWWDCDTPVDLDTARALLP